MISLSEFLHDNFSVETKDGNCCSDKDHADLFCSFPMKDAASDDIANVLQDLANVTTENSPIHVLGE